MMIRPMRWWDIEAVAAIESVAFDDSWSTEQFWGELAQPTRFYVVAEHDDIVGYAGLFVLAPDADIQTLAVAPGHRGAGIGGSLLDALLEAGRQRGCTSMLLEVRSDNPAAFQLYRSRGFDPISTRANYYAPGVDAIVMRKRPLEA